MHNIYRFKTFVHYQWKAKTKYYLHSPFIFRFYLDILEGRDNNTLTPLKQARKNLAQNTTPVKITDLGTGANRSLTLSTLESRVAIPDKYGKALFRLVQKFKPATIIELGTSIGISSAYMAMAYAPAKVLSIEGSAELAQAAQQLHGSLGISNVHVITGNFDTELEKTLRGAAPPLLVYFDGNHRKTATLQYFNACFKHADENSIFIFDDIYWSPEMTEAWEEIKKHPAVTLTIDIYKMGICFFRKENLAKENFILRY